MSIAEIERNMRKKPLEVRHSELTRAGDSMYKSFCIYPKCKGVLFMQRDSTYRLQAADMCSFCGRRYIYIDANVNPIFNA